MCTYSCNLKVLRSALCFAYSKLRPFLATVPPGCDHALSLTCCGGRVSTPTLASTRWMDRGSVTVLFSLPISPLLIHSYNIRVDLEACTPRSLHRKMEPLRRIYYCCIDAKVWPQSSRMQDEENKKKTKSKLKNMDKLCSPADLSRHLRIFTW
jgi:hypothetical protein